MTTPSTSADVHDPNLAADQADAATERTARLRAESADAAKDAFLLRLGHEWRTPLGAIAAAADVLRGLAPPDDPLARDACEVIQRQTLRLAGRIDAVLDATRFISGHAPLATGRADLADVAAQAVGAALAEGIADHCELRLTRGEVPVVVDAARVAQAVSQLLSNALLATPAGGTVEVEVDEDAAGPFLRVRDDGPGLHPVAAARLVGRPAPPPVDGLAMAPPSGLGLRFVAAVMARHGGRCEVDNAPDGACVTLRFPAAPG